MTRSENSKVVGAVSVKGSRDQAAGYPEVLRRVLAKVAQQDVVAA